MRKDIMEKYNTYFYFAPNTLEKNQKTVKYTVQTVIDKTLKNKEFFNEMKFYIIDKAQNTPKASLFTKTIKQLNMNGALGVTINPVFNENNKEIAIFENQTSWFKQKLYTPKYHKHLSQTEIKNVTLHEMGHQFDSYFGEKPNEEVNYAIENCLEELELFELLHEYRNKSELSDSDEFKQAWKKDVENLAKNQYCNDIKDILYYFSPEFFKTNGVRNVIISDGISDEELQFSESERGEVFAQAFAFNLGADSENYNEEVFRSTYKNCIEVVKKYIKEFLGIRAETMEERIK